MYNFNANDASFKRCVTKFLVCIKLSFIFLIIPSLNVSAAPTEQKITLFKKDATLVEIFSEIRKQIDYDFVYSEKQIAQARKVTIAVKGASIKEALDICFKHQPLVYLIANKTIIIKFKIESIDNLPIQTNYKVNVKGKIVNQQGKPISNALIKVKETLKSTTSNEEGDFVLTGVDEKSILVISYVGFLTKEIKIEKAELGNIVLSDKPTHLNEVEIVSTGYQNIPKERATGSFTQINTQILERKVSTNILDRLDGVTSGLLFNRNKDQENQSDFNIRGRSTIFGEDKPLIVVDNFPYEGDISNINPNIVKSVTILKDAAAASIWGTRAGNGVVVITTLQGDFGKKQELTFNANVTLSNKPNLFKLPWFSSSQWIEIEQNLYSQGAFNSAIANGYEAISPAVAIMNLKERGLISAADSLKRINNLKGQDIRNDMLKYLFRPRVNQQYAFSVKGGGENNKYYVAAGLDNELGNSKTDSYQRFTLNANNTYRFLDNKLELNLGLLFTASTTKTSNQKYTIPSSPYDLIADENGSPLAVRRQLSMSYIDSVGRGKLLDWHYRPLDENYSNSKSILTSIIVNSGLNYSISKAFKASALFQYQNQTIDQTIDNDQNSYYTRDLINTFSILTGGEVQRPIPLGAIWNNGLSKLNSKYGRLQLNYNESYGDNHVINGIAGFEIRNNYTTFLSQRMYGYNKETYTNLNSTIDFTKDYQVLYSGDTQRLDLNQNSSYVLDRYLSYFANLSYQFKNRYLLSVSARKDESNLFGVKPNQKGVPLWSAGVSWEVNKEPFYRSTLLPYLRLRGSYGYSGNVSKNLSAYLTAQPVGENRYGQQFNMIINPPNPSLAWEKVKTINLGLDYSFIKNRINGSIEPFLKYGQNLFGQSPLAPQTGVSVFVGNTANTKTKGIDFTINTVNLNRKIKWTSTILFSLIEEKVTKYSMANGSNSQVISQSYNNPIEGNPYFSIYGYRWAGLDKDGNPTIKFHDVQSTDYGAISNSLDRSSIKLIGSSVPTKYGNVLNTLAYKDLSISFNITYRLGYYFRKPSLSNTSVYSASGYQNNIDYENRWKQPGDENKTNVPALLYPNDFQRDNAYVYSDLLVDKADNIRFQDIQLNWNIRNLRTLKNYFAGFQVYFYMNNIGYIWKANKSGFDPDFPVQSVSMMPPQKSFAIGIKASL